MSKTKKIIIGALCFTVILVVAIGFSVPQLIKTNRGSSPQIIQARLGNVDLYIPKDYVRFGHTSIGTESALIQAWYPGATPVPGKGDNSTELWRQGLWGNNIRILLHSNPNIPLWENDRILKSLERLNATLMVGQEYGLLHKTQPEGKVQDAYDVWLEMNGNKIISYITCSDEWDREWYYPQCSHYIELGYQDAGKRVRAHISYDRRLLPEWKTIKDNVGAMFESFESQDTAKEFILLRRQDVAQSPLKRKEITSTSQHNGEKK